MSELTPRKIIRRGAAAAGAILLTGATVAGVEAANDHADTIKNKITPEVSKLERNTKHLGEGTSTSTLPETTSTAPTTIETTPSTTTTTTANRLPSQIDDGVIEDTTTTTLAPSQIDDGVITDDPEHQVPTELIPPITATNPNYPNPPQSPTPTP